MKANNRPQVGGTHYQGVAMQPIHFSELAGLGFNEGSVIKYIVRWRKKNGLEDIDKVKDYLGIILEMAQVKSPGCLPILRYPAPLPEFLAQYPFLTQTERNIIRAVTMWRRHTTLSSGGRRQLDLLREARKSAELLTEIYLRDPEAK